MKPQTGDRAFHNAGTGIADRDTMEIINFGVKVGWKKVARPRFRLGSWRY